MGKRKKTGALGDDPLGWMKNKKDVHTSESVKENIKRDENINISKKSSVADKNDISNDIDNNIKEPVVKLENIMSIGDVNKLHITLRNLINMDSDILIDASDIQSIDTAVLQLLTAFCMKVNKNGHNIKWKNPSQVFIDRCCLLNLEELLRLN
jgi:anti-anti-sigma regulatory factor